MKRGAEARFYEVAVDCATLLHARKSTEGVARQLRRRTDFVAPVDVDPEYTRAAREAAAEAADELCQSLQNPAGWKVSRPMLLLAYDSAANTCLHSAAFI